ncbi:MAG TPA: hypothetical protein EYH01_07760 [Campylobacterales bacterium]|nr:hypothetical protein [Campylobacterales bacterium]
MHFRHLLFALIIAALFSGCSAKSKGYFEDLYSATEVRSATNQDYSVIKAPKNAPIIRDIQPQSSTKRYTSDVSQVYHGTGKIIDADYDKDVNLYVYAFLKSGTSNPITFYYDEDLNPIGGIVTITIKDNFLTSITNSQPEKSQRTNKKRKRSRIKTPIIEKINTL